MGIDSLKNGIEGAIVTIKANPVNTALGVAGVGLAAGLGAAAVVGQIKRRKSKRSKNRRSRSRRSRIKHTKRGWSMDRKRRSNQKWEIAYQRRKRKSKKSKRGVHYTKNGQPYVILSSGKARFIKGKRRKR